MRQSWTLAVAVLGVAALPVPAVAATVTVEATENKFSAPSGPVSAGDTVVFHNSGTQPHNAKAPDGSFNIPLINAGQSKSVVVAKGGAIPYVCTFHETLGMKATLTVAAAEGATDSEAGAAVETSPSPPQKKSAASPPAAPAEAPPTEKYFPKLAVLLMLLLIPLVGLGYRNFKKGGPAAKVEAAPAAED